MRVLVLHSELGTLRGGGENFTRNLFASFVDRGHQVSAAFTADPLGRYPFRLPASIEPLPVPGWWSENLGQAALSAIGRRLSMRSLRSKWDYAQNALAWRTFQWSNRRFQRRVMQKMERAVWDSDVVYVHCNPFLATEVAKIRPTILRLPGPLTSESLPILRNIHAVCANGDALTRLRTFLGARALELPVGLDERLFAPGSTSMRSSLGWTPQHRVVGYVGRLSRIKGVDLLADSFRAVSKEDSAARLLIVGSGEEERTLRAVLKMEIAREVVHLAGDVPHEELPDWYRTMDVSVMPSRYENYSNAVLEGLACAIPFVGSDVGGNRTLYETGAGWLFEQGSVSSLAAVLTGALADSRARETRGARGRQHVSGRYNWSATAKRLEEIICTLRPST